jgi:predicted Zn-dependent protease
VEKLRSGREDYLARLDGVAFGENPRQGFFQGDAFLHPDLRFRIDLPGGWKKANTAAAVVAVSPREDAAVQLSIAGPLSPQEASQRFFAQEGIRPAALAGSAAGVPGTATWFEAQTEQGALRGLVAFVAHGGTTLQLVGFTRAQQIDAHAPTFQRTFATFGPLTDPAALAVQPARVQIVKVPRDMTLAEFAAEFPSNVPVEVLATANGMTPDGRFVAGQSAKRVVGGEVPRS